MFPALLSVALCNRILGSPSQTPGEWHTLILISAANIVLERRRHWTAEQEGQTAEMVLCEYELQRERRIAENNRRLEEMGILQVNRTF